MIIDGDGHFFETEEIFEKHMPTARHGLGVAVLGQSIYVIAGGPKPGATFSSVNEMFTP